MIPLLHGSLADLVVALVPMPVFLPSHVIVPGTAPALVPLSPRRVFPLGVRVPVPVVGLLPFLLLAVGHALWPKVVHTKEDTENFDDM